MSSAEPKSGPAIWLIGSFVLNALLIGLMLGMFLAAPKGRPKPSPNIQISEEALARSIVAAAPQQDRRHVRRTLVRAWQSASEERQKLAEASQEVGLAIRADPYDPAALETALGNWRKADMAMKESLDVALSEVLEKLPVEQREALARDLAERSTRRRPRDGARREGRQRPTPEREQDPG